jgi:RNA polymerase sigma-70 factor (ECF subfamily)
MEVVAVATAIQPETPKAVRASRGALADRAAFPALYREHIDEVHAYLAVALGNDTDADDVAQEVFLKVFQALPRYDPSKAPFHNWLFVIARHCAISHHRKEGRQAPTDPARLDASGETRQAADPVARPAWGSTAVLHEQLADLPKLQRDVVVLTYRANLDVDEIAGLLHLTQPHVRQLKCRALARLRLAAAALGGVLLIVLDVLFDVLG